MTPAAASRRDTDPLTASPAPALDLQDENPTSQALANSAEKVHMSADSVIRIPSRLQVLAATAMLLERLDQLPRSASADQYQRLVRQIDRLLDDAEGEPSLQALLDGLPGLAELHENRNYAVAGLCRSPLTTSVASEHAARELLERISRRH
jgi:hypothetical protein